MSTTEPLALQLAVQYGTDAPELPRWRLRRWVLAALQQLQVEGVLPSPPTDNTDPGATSFESLPMEEEIEEAEDEADEADFIDSEDWDEDGFPSTALSGLSLTLRLVDAEEGRQLNRDFRERDYATNVLTFPYGMTPDGMQHADVVLCVPVLHREALEQGKPLLSHAAHLVIHGTLHALGYDHEEDSEALIMEALETRILARLRIPNPYTDD